LLTEVSIANAGRETDNYCCHLCKDIFAGVADKQPDIFISYYSVYLKLMASFFNVAEVILVFISNTWQIIDFKECNNWKCLYWPAYVGIVAV